MRYYYKLFYSDEDCTSVSHNPTKWYEVIECEEPKKKWPRFSGIECWKRISKAEYFLEMI